MQVIENFAQSCNFMTSTFRSSVCLIQLPRSPTTVNKMLRAEELSILSFCWCIWCVNQCFLYGEQVEEVAYTNVFIFRNFANFASFHVLHDFKLIPSVPLSPTNCCFHDQKVCPLPGVLGITWSPLNIGIYLYWNEFRNAGLSFRPPGYI